MSSDWWDDFFNNLATDLAPLISLLGESPTIQFLSEMVSPIDIFVLAMAPLGILTIVVSAIRVGGSPPLRAFIGRAQEGDGKIELELCSSTSRDVCEMYNNGGIARVLGRPKILEIVHNPRADTKDFYGLERKTKSAGIYYFSQYIDSGNGDEEWKEVTGSQNILRSRKMIMSELESHRFPKRPVDPYFAVHPNLVLNIGIKNRSPNIYFSLALLGFLLQSGVLVFAGLSVFAFSKRFEKDDKHTDAYAFPFTLVGTLLLCIGVGMCGHVVERSTKERIFKRKPTTLENGSGSRLFWIQPGNQVIGDQVFDPFAYNDTPGAPLNQYITSRRTTPNEEIQRTNNLLVYIFVPVTIFGYVLQFIGFRALHSTISLAQLGVTIYMSILRSTVRTRRFKKEDNRLGDDSDHFQGHELDWLAMELYRDRIKEEFTVWQTEAQPQAPSELHPHTINNHPTYTWQVASYPTHPQTALVSDKHRTEGTGFVSLSIKDTGIVLLLGSLSVPTFDSFKSNSTSGGKGILQWLADMQKKEGTEVLHLVPIIFLSRARIACLTGVDPKLGSSRDDSRQWGEDVVPVRGLAATLADALRRTADALFRDRATPPVLKDGWADASTLFLALECSVAEVPTSNNPMHHLDNSQRNRVYISLSRASTDQGDAYGYWNIDTSEIEAILGLWMWSLRIRFRGPEKTSDSSASLYFERLKSTRLLFVSEAKTDGATSSNIALYQSTLRPWLGGLGTKVRRARLSYPTIYGFDPTWIWELNADVYSPIDLSRTQHSNPTDNAWFTGWDLFDRYMLPQQPHWALDVLITRTGHSPALMCTQEIYTKLFRNLLNILEDIGGETKVVKGSHGFCFVNDNISEIIEAFTDSGLGSENDARACIIPALLQMKKLPVGSMVAQARELGDEYRREGSWDQSNEVLRWAFDTSLQLCKSRPAGSEEQSHEASTAPEHLESTMKPNDPIGELWLCVLTLCEFYRWALFCQGRISVKEGGIYGIKNMLELRKTLSHLALPHLEDTLEAYGKVALRVAKQTANVPNLHYAISHLEQILGDNEVSLKPKVASGCLEADHSTREIHESSQENVQKDRQQESQTQDQEIYEDSLISAIKNGDMSATLYYIRGPSAIQEDKEGRSSLSLAAEKGWFIVVKSLVEVGATVRQSDTLKRTPLHLAASSGDKYLVSYLLEQGVDVNSRDIYHRTPLLIAAEHGHKAIVEILLKAGANVNSRDAQHRTPLLLAVEHGHIATLKIILRAGANLNVNSNLEDGHEETTAHLAEEQTRADILELINQERQRRRGESDG